MKRFWLLLGIALTVAPGANAQNAIGEVFAADAGVQGAVLLSSSGTHVLSGSQITAGEVAALLKLERGGELRICAKTNVSLSSDATGKALVLGLNAGAMELDYSLQSSADMLITPDFRVQLISPGSFHLAVSVAPNGDTCLRSLPGNDASVFVAETMGADSYQLSPGKNVMFRAGKISGATEAPAVCGCPETKQEMMKAAVSPGTQAATTGGTEAAAAGATLPTTSSATLSAKPEAAEPAVDKTGAAKLEEKRPTEAHLEVDSGFVYEGDKAEQDIYGSVSRLSLSSDNSKLTLALLPQVSGPAVAELKPAAQKQTRLGRFRRFLGRLFQD